MKALMLIALVLVTSCASNKTTPAKKEEPVVVVTPSPIETPVVVELPPIVIDVPTTPVVNDKDCGKPWKPEWNGYIENSLSTKESLKKLNKGTKFFVAFVKALAKAESCLNLAERYVETGLGKDAVTGTQNTSEGLLQLSYQDAKYHGCGFNWQLDKQMNVKSLDKTIFDPKLNLECGMIILEKQVKTYGILVTERTPYYWAVLNKANKRYATFTKYLKAEGFSL